MAHETSDHFMDWQDCELNEDAFENNIESSDMDWQSGQSEELEGFGIENNNMVHSTPLRRRPPVVFPNFTPIWSPSRIRNAINLAMERMAQLALNFVDRTFIDQ